MTAARAHLYTRIQAGIRHTLVGYGGHDRGGAAHDRDAWRSAPLDDLVTAIMAHLRAGLDPVMDGQAIADAVAWAKRHETGGLPDGGRVRMHLHDGTVITGRYSIDPDGTEWVRDDWGCSWPVEDGGFRRHIETLSEAPEGEQP